MNTLRNFMMGLVTGIYVGIGIAAAIIILSSCGAPETAFAGEDVNQLMLCDAEGACEKPGQLVLFGMDQEHNPLHYAAVTEEQAQPFIESGMVEDVVFASYTEVNDFFDIRCDHLAKDVFGCARAGETEFDNDLRLRLCNRGVCTEVPQLVLLSGDDLTHTPFGWVYWDADRWLNDASAGAEMRAKYEHIDTRFDVVCDTAVDGLNPMICLSTP